MNSEEFFKVCSDLKLCERIKNHENLSSVLGVNKKNTEYILLKRVKKALELLYDDEKIVQEIIQEIN